MCLFTVHAQTKHQIDLGTISEYDTITGRLSYYSDFGQTTLPEELPGKTFSFPDNSFPFDLARPTEYYYMKMSVHNSGKQDTFWLYLGKAQQYTMYEYDDSTGKIITLNNQAAAFSYAIFNELPYAYFTVKPGESKIFFIRAKSTLYNQRLFDPIIIIPDELTTFTFEYFLQPNRIYIFISLLLLGIMFSLFFSFASFYIKTFDSNYLFYTLALLCYLIYFFLRIFDNFIFSSSYWLFFDARQQILQIGGSIAILVFVISFLQIHHTLPRIYKYFRIIVLLQILFLIINVPLTYTNKYHIAGTASFNILRLFILPYFILLIAAITKHIKTRESRYIAVGSLISILLFLFALYADVISIYKSTYINHQEIALLAFTAGILIQMRFFMEAIVFRTKNENDLQIRELEQLKLKNERTELEQQKAIFNAKEKERNRISQEIHDDIGSGLTSIRLLSEIAKTKNVQPSDKELEKISATSNILIDKMNEIVWSLNSKNDTLPNLLSFLRHFTVEYFEPMSIQLHISTPENIPEINVNGKVRRNLLLCSKEAMHNIVKHSQATVVHVNFSVGGDFTITISDNGIGFNPSNIAQHKNGLQNIQDRIAAIGGFCTITNKNGTTIAMQIPLQSYPV